MVRARERCARRLAEIRTVPLHVEYDHGEAAKMSWRQPWLTVMKSFSCTLPASARYAVNCRGQEDHRRQAMIAL